MYDYPLLKYAVNVKISSFEIELSYRGKTYNYPVKNPTLYKKLLENCSGRNLLKDIIQQCNIEKELADDFLCKISEIPLLLDGKVVLRDDGLLSGRELFWKLEKFLIEWKQKKIMTAFRVDLDKEIALGKAPENVVKGFCLELCHLLRNVPDELSLAVANARSDYIRAHYMTFYDEERTHGDIIFRSLKKWMNAEDIIHATPLPATIGLLNTYRYWASKDSLFYAVALMRDESSALDAEIQKDEDIFVGMKTHYQVPKQVYKVYEWHTNLDRNNNHGFFPELIFAEYEYIDQFYAKRLISALKQIIELHQQFRWSVYHYYSEHPVETRFEPYKALNFQ